MASKKIIDANRIEKVELTNTDFFHNDSGCGGPGGLLGYSWKNVANSGNRKWEKRERNQPVLP